MATNNQRTPNLRAATVARVNQLLKTGLSKAGAFEKISAETGRAKDAVQMLYYRAMRASASKSVAKPVVAQAAAKPALAAKSAPSSKVTAAPKVAQKAAPVALAPVAVAPKPRPSRRWRRRSRSASASSVPRPAAVAQSGDFPVLLNGIASAINALLKHVEKTVAENKTLKQQADRLKAITSLIRGR